MGWFSKAIPERKWAEVSATLGTMLKTEALSWYSVFRQQSAVGRTLSSDTLTDPATHNVHLLQLQAVSSTVQEGGYIADLADVTFFLELVYIVLTGRPPSQLYTDIETTPFCLGGNAKDSLALWAQSLVEDFPLHERDPQLVQELGSYGAFVVARASVATCVACGDRNRAEAIRSTFVG